MVTNNTYYIDSFDTNESIPSVNDGYYVYILKCSDGSYYTGYTANLYNRVLQHKSGTGCIYTKTRTPLELVYKENLPNNSTSLKREKQIKKLTIFDKERLIEKSRLDI